MYFWSKLHTYFAEAFLNLNQIAEAQSSLEIACKILKIKCMNSRTLSLQTGLDQLKKVKKFLKNNTYGTKSPENLLIYTAINLQMVETYNCVFELFRLVKKHNESFIVAIAALNKAVKYSHQHHIIIKCYANIIETGKF